MADDEPADGAPSLTYCEKLRAPLHVVVSTEWPKATVHRSEYAKVLAGEPTEINPSVGAGHKVMTVGEYVSRWKRNDDFPECLSCGSTATKEHHFVQSWCRGKRAWESESFCTACHSWSWRSYTDPDFMTPEQHEKAKWEAMMRGAVAPQPAAL